MRQTLLLFSCLVLNSCGHVWEIQRDPSGGRLGYRDYFSASSANKALSKVAASNCPSFIFTSDQAFSTTSNMTSYQYVPVTVGTQTGGAYVPISQPVIETWGEASYRCVTPPGAGASGEP